jgi:prepilin-type N-terminal cleavage/methylation domain-containing protein
MKPGSRAGFSLVELLITVTIVGVLASLAVPRYKGIKLRAQASQVIGDFDVVRQAVLNFYVDSSRFPAESPVGVVPSGLEQYLPEHFTFLRGDWQLDYDRVSMGAGQAGPGDVFVGIAAVATDRTLADIVVRTLDLGLMQQGNRVTFIIAPL